MKNFITRHSIFYLILILFYSNHVFAKVVVVNGLCHEFNCTTGDSVKGQIELENPDDREQNVRIYQTDYTFDANGKTFYGEPGSIFRSNSTWIEFSPKSVVIPPGENYNIVFEIHAPQIDSLSGSYWSMLMVEGVNPIEPVKAEKGIGINTVIRYGVQIISHIGETGEKLLKFTQTKIDTIDSNKVLLVDVENVGTRAQSPKLSINLYDNEGNSIAARSALPKRVYPGTSSRFYIDLNGVNQGTYKALLIADSGDADVFGMNITLKLK